MKLIIPAIAISIFTAGHALSGVSGAATTASSASGSQDFGMLASDAPSDCGAEHMTYLRGQQVDEVDVSSLSQHVRVAYPDTPIPSQPRSDRLSLDVSDAGVILATSCR
ncbi:hypothetical protein [Maricaulis sp. CAU 1757]